MKRISTASFFCSLFVVCFISFPFSVDAAVKLRRGFHEEVVAYGLRQPVAAAYAPDGRLFIAEKQGRIRIFKDGKLLKKPFLVVKVNSLYERGLLGLALDPDFSENSFVYIYRTTSAANPQNVVERYTARGDQAVASSRKLLLSGIRSDSGLHNAGCLRFGPDGKLYVSAGDGGQDSTLAQDLGSLNGKILRINRDGTIPPDNPFVNRAGARPEIWCSGLRNPWRFAFDGKTGLLVIGDVGADAYEELNIGTPGANFGWPLAEGPSSDPQFVNPVYIYNHEAGGAAVTIGTFYSGKKFPAKLHNRLFLTDYARSFIKILRLDGTGRMVSIRNFASGLNTPVDMAEASDGSIIYVSLSGGEIRRIRYVGGKNRPPSVKIGATPRSGLAPLPVKFSSAGTFDPDKNPVTFFWDLGDGTTSTAANPSHVYARNGTYFVILKVTDSKGATGFSRSLKIVSGNIPPIATITAPVDGTVVRPGQVVQFSGKGTDAEDGEVAPENMFWSAKLYHNDHTHPALGGIRGTTGSFPIPSSVHATGNLFFRLKLRVVDSGNLIHSQTIDLPLATQ